MPKVLEKSCINTRVIRKSATGNKVGFCATGNSVLQFEEGQLCLILMPKKKYTVRDDEDLTSCKLRTRRTT